MEIAQTRSEAESRAEATTALWRAAAEAGDLDGFMATLSPEVVFHSPITTRTPFEGHAEVRTLMKAVFATIEELRYTDDIGDENLRALVYQGKIGAQEVHEASILRLNEHAEIVEVTFWVRPLPGLAALTAALGPKLAREHSQPRALAVWMLASPLYWFTRIGDWLGVRLAR